MNAEVFHTLAVGDIISYTLSWHQRSSPSSRTYRGVVNRIHTEAQTVSVRLLDGELEALNEAVSMADILSAVKACSVAHLQQEESQGGSHA